MPMRAHPALLAVVALATVAGALVACSGVSSNLTSSQASSSDPSQVIMTFSINDLQAADKIAKASGDTIASTCYEYLIPKVQALQAAEATSQASVAGVASFAEVSRGITVQLNNAKSGLNVACAPLAMDTMATALQLAGQLTTASAAIATGGASLIPVAP
jgi:hypothetical protein